MSGSLSSIEASKTKKIRVYVVDDHSLVRAGVAAILSLEQDMEHCGGAADYETALREITELRPDVAVVDLSLRGRSGLELIKALRGLRPVVRTCVLSVHDESVYAMRVLKAGAGGYVMKQQSPSVLTDAIRKIARNQKVVSDRILDDMLQPLRGEELNDRVKDLSDDELEIATLMGRGTATAEIAARLKISIRAVAARRARLKKKLKMQSGPELLRLCIRLAQESDG